ncbi:chlorophyllase [Pseudoscourfieldia marina]
MTVISSHLHHGATMREQSTALVADPLGESAEVRVWWPTTPPTTTTTSTTTTTTTTSSSSSSGASSTRRSLPSILFHHGTALGPSDYTSLCSHIASYGFIVVCRRHYNGPIGLLRWQNEVRAARHMQAFVTDTGIYVGEHSFHAQLLRAVGGAEEQAPVVDTTKGLLLAGHSRGAAIAFLGS